MARRVKTIRCTEWMYRKWHEFRTNALSDYGTASPPFSYLQVLVSSYRLYSVCLPHYPFPFLTSAPPGSTPTPGRPASAFRAPPGRTRT